MSVNAEQFLRDALREVLGGDGYDIDVQHGPYQGDPWNGSTAFSTVASKGLRHPRTSRSVGVSIQYSEHDLSGQTDSWSVTMTGFPAAESERLRALLSPFERVRNLNVNLRYRWSIDGKSGSSTRNRR